MNYTGTINIDGQGSFTYVLTPLGAVVSPSGSMAVPGSPAATEGTFEVLLLSHSMKSDVGKNGKPYERHAFRGSDNRNYVTFKREVVAQLQPFVNSGKPVRIIGAQTKFGVDIDYVDQSTRPVPMPAGTTAPVDDDVPF